MDDSATIHLFRGPPSRTLSGRVQAIRVDGELHSPVELTADFESDSDDLHHSYSSNPLKGACTPLTSSPLESKTFLDGYSAPLNKSISLAPSSPSSPVQHRPPPSTPRRRDSSVGRVVVQHEIAHALSALDANVLALQAARYDPDLQSAPNTPVNGSSYLSVKESPRTPLSRPSAPTPGSERSVSGSLPPSPLRGLFPRRAGSFTLPSPPLSPTVEALGSGDDEDVFGFIPNTPTQRGCIADPDDWTLSSHENSMEASMSLRDMLCAGTNPRHIHRVQAQAPGGDGDGEGELDESELSVSTPTPPLGDAASPVNQAERVHITTVELSADEMHLVGAALLQAMEDVLERDFDILAKFEYTHCLVRSDDWWAEPEVSCGDEESLLDYISYHASDSESESDDSADLHLSHDSYLNTRSSWDEQNGIIPCLPLLGEVDTASSDDLQSPDSPTAFHDQTAAAFDDDVRSTSSDRNFETDELDDSYDRGYDPARCASLSTIYEVSTENDNGQPTDNVHAYDSEEEGTGDEDSHESLLAVAMQRVRVLLASIDFDALDESDDDELPGPHPSPNSDGANDHSVWGADLSSESLSFNNAIGSALSTSEYNRPRSSKLADRAGLVGLPPVHDSYLPRTDNGSPPLETPELDTAMRAEYGFGRVDLGLGTASRPHVGEPRDIPLLTAPRVNTEVGGLRANLYCRMYQEPAEHYRLSPDATAALVPEAQVDKTIITPRSARRASFSAAVKGGEANSPKGKGEWSASDTLALLNGWSDDERDEKELELRRKYRDTAGPKTAGRAVIKERIAELERKIALSKTYKASEAVGNGEGRVGVAGPSKNLRSLGELKDELVELEAYKRFVGGAASGDAQWATQIADIDRRLATLRLDLTKTYKHLAHATVSRHKGGVRNRSVARTLSSKVDERAADERESMQNFRFGSPPPSPSSPTFAAYPSTTSRAAAYGPGGIEQHGFIAPNAGSRHRRRSRFEGPDLSDVEEIEERDSTHVDSEGGHDAVEERWQVRLEDESALNDGELCSMVDALRDCIAGGHLSPTNSEATGPVFDIKRDAHDPEWQTSILSDTEHLKVMNRTDKGDDRDENRTDETWTYTPDDHYTPPPTPRPAHSVSPHTIAAKAFVDLRERMDHRRSFSVPTPSSLGWRSGTTYPALPLLRPSVFSPDQTYISLPTHLSYRKNVDLKNGGCTLDQVAQQVMTIPERGYYPRTPTGQFPPHEQYRPPLVRRGKYSAPPLTSPNAVESRAERLAELEPREQRRHSSASGVRGLLIHPPNLESQPGPAVDTGEALFHHTLSADFAGQPHPSHGSSPPVTSSSIDAINQPQQDYDITPRVSSCEHFHPISCRGIGFFSRLRAAVANSLPDSPSRHSAAPSPNPHVQENQAGPRPPQGCARGSSKPSNKPAPGHRGAHNPHPTIPVEERNPVNPTVKVNRNKVNFDIQDGWELVHTAIDPLAAPATQQPHLKGTSTGADLFRGFGL